VGRGHLRAAFGTISYQMASGFRLTQNTEDDVEIAVNVEACTAPPKSPNWPLLKNAAKGRAEAHARPRQPVAVPGLALWTMGLPRRRNRRVGGGVYGAQKLVGSSPSSAIVFPMCFPSSCANGSRTRRSVTSTARGSSGLPGRATRRLINSSPGINGQTFRSTTSALSAGPGVVGPVSLTTRGPDGNSHVTLR